MIVGVCTENVGQCISLHSRRQSQRGCTFPRAPISTRLVFFLMLYRLSESGYLAQVCETAHASCEPCLSKLMRKPPLEVGCDAEAFLSSSRSDLEFHT